MLIHVIFGLCLYVDAIIHVHTSTYMFDHTCGNVCMCICVCRYVYMCVYL